MSCILCSSSAFTDCQTNIQQQDEARVCTSSNVVLRMSCLQGPGQSRVQYCMAALLATLVLDEQAMGILQQRGEGHLVFEVTLKLVSL